MNNEIYLRLFSFISILLIVSFWEVIFPRKILTTKKSTRWINNGLIIFINTLTIRFFISVLPAIFAIEVQKSGHGFFNMIDLPYGAEFIFAILILDFIIYLQHAMFHTFPLLWRLHMVHHTDLDIDVTTGLRFHPIEIIISIGIKLAAVLLIGPTPESVIIFEIILNGAAMFNHGNIYINPVIDKILRLIIVTPDMHRVHHSVRINETNSNFGFNLPWWDYIFGTYKSQPINGHDKVIIGLSQYRDPAKLTLHRLLALPFHGDTGKYPIGRRNK